MASDVPSFEVLVRDLKETCEQLRREGAIDRMLFPNLESVARVVDHSATRGTNALTLRYRSVDITSAEDECLTVSIPRQTADPLEAEVQADEPESVFVRIVVSRFVDRAREALMALRYT